MEISVVVRYIISSLTFNLELSSYDSIVHYSN